MKTVTLELHLEGRRAGLGSTTKVFQAEEIAQTKAKQPQIPVLIYITANQLPHLSPLGGKQEYALPSHIPGYVD